MGLGLIFLPITKKIFANFFDQGYLFSKVITLLFSSYFVWLLASLKILPFYKETIWLVLLLGLIVNLMTLRKKNPQDKTRSQHLLLICVFEELIFLTTLVLWSFIRGFQPDIQGLEKFMDFGFVNSILRSKYFPPADIWFAGKSINYYYFGHYITAFLTKLTNINSAVTYNLMIATLFAFCFSLTFSLTGNLIYFYLLKKFDNLRIDFKFQISNFKFIILGGLVSALLVSLSANLHPAFYNFKMQILRKPYCDGAFTYWYPNATRYIGYCPDVDDKTIHEFPSYSFIVSDLHGHVSDIPFVLTFLALSFTLFLKIKEGKDLLWALIFKSPFLIFSFLLGIMFMTNQWDYPIYLMVLGFVLFFGFFQHYGKNVKTITQSALLGIIILIPSIILFLPFQLGFDPIVKGIAFVRTHSLPHQLLILWGAPWFFGLTLLIYLFGYKIKIKNIFKKENFIKWISKFLNVDIELKNKKEKPLIANYSLLITDVFVLILFLVSTILIIIPEIIYVKDIYIASYHRANTVFKLTYQSFIMFSVGIGYVLTRVLSSLKKGFKRNLLLVSYTFLLFCLLVYPFYSIKGYYGSLAPKTYKGLFGMQFMQRLYPDDYKTIVWLNNNVSGQPNILEAVGDSYTDYERISMATGLPTIEGWLVHEWLWRGSFDEPGKRQTEVQTIYESKDISQTKELLNKYHIKYLIVGEMERQKYPNLNQEKLTSLGKKVFESSQTAVYELP